MNNIMKNNRSLKLVYKTKQVHKNSFINDVLPGFWVIPKIASANLC